MSNSTIDNIAIAGFTVSLFTIFMLFVMFLIFIMLCRKIIKLERRLDIERGRKLLTTEQQCIETQDPRHGSGTEPEDTGNVERKVSIPTPKLSRPVHHADHSYENTQPQQQNRQQEERPMSNNTGSVPHKTMGEASGNYTTMPHSLPAFLRNDEMLSVPVVSGEQVQTAQKDFDESYARLSMLIVDKDGGDYMDPQDARNKTVTTKTHEKLDQRVSRSKQSAEVNTGLKMPFTEASREDYTEVSDALNDSTVVNLSNSTSTNIRPRTTSDTSPVKKIAHEQVRKTFSVKHRTTNNLSNPNSQPLKRKSSAKEVVTFDPKGGFKLTARRSSSDGVPQSALLSDPQTNSSNPQTSSSNPQTPVLDGNKTLSQPPPSQDVGGKHMYAAVDLTAKCRPETDVIRREGVGTPDHYIACV